MGAGPARARRTEVERGAGRLVAVQPRPAVAAPRSRAPAAPTMPTVGSSKCRSSAVSQPGSGTTSESTKATNGGMRRGQPGVARRRRAAADVDAGPASRRTRRRPRDGGPGSVEPSSTTTTRQHRRAARPAAGRSCRGRSRTGTTTVTASRSSGSSPGRVPSQAGSRHVAVEEQSGQGSRRLRRRRAGGRRRAASTADGLQVQHRPVVDPKRVVPPSATCRPGGEPDGEARRQPGVRPSPGVGEQRGHSRNPPLAGSTAPWTAGPAKRPSSTTAATSSGVSDRPMACVGDEVLDVRQVVEARGRGEHRGVGRSRGRRSTPSPATPATSAASAADQPDHRVLGHARRPPGGTGRARPRRTRRRRTPGVAPPAAPAACGTVAFAVFQTPTASVSPHRVEQGVGPSPTARCRRRSPPRPRRRRRAARVRRRIRSTAPVIACKFRTSATTRHDRGPMTSGESLEILLGGQRIGVRGQLVGRGRTVPAQVHRVHDVAASDAAGARPPRRCPARRPSPGRPAPVPRTRSRRRCRAGDGRVGGHRRQPAGTDHLERGQLRDQDVDQPLEQPGALLRGAARGVAEDAVRRDARRRPRRAAAASAR